MSDATLLISSKNYSSWSLRGFLLVRMSGLSFDEKIVDLNNPATRAELLLRSSSILVPSLVHNGINIWDTLAIAEYLNEVRPKAAMFPEDRMARALPFHFWGNSFGIFGAAVILADESSRAPTRISHLGVGASRYRPHLRDLARMPGNMGRAVAAGPRALRRGCDVCAGGHAVSKLRCTIGRCLCQLLRPYSQMGAAAGMERSRTARA